MPPSWEEHEAALEEAHRLAAAYLADVGRRRVGATAGPAELKAAFDGGLPEQGLVAKEVVAELAAAADRGSSPPPGRATSAS